jgi:phosphoglycolate phosphatase
LSRQILESLDVAGYFAHIAGGDTYEEMKPSPLPLLRVTEALGVSVAETVMIGDSINDIQAGNRAGILTIGCSWGYGSSEELDGAALRVSSLSELSAVLTRTGVA